MYRKELKFIIPEEYLRLIESRLKVALKRDKHQVGDYYCIRSIYFDSPSDICYRENRAGVGERSRKKYRIRAYGNLNPITNEIEMSDKKISAEIKLRYRDAISKESVDITKEMLFDIINGNHNLVARMISKDTFIEREKKVLRQYIDKIAGEHYIPKTIVEYKRSAYVYEPSNVRITFDRDITACSNYEGLFTSNLHGIPVMDKGINVLEVKYDEFLPDEIRMLLAGIDLERTSCSKYCMCRELIMKYMGR